MKAKSCAELGDERMESLERDCIVQIKDCFFDAIGGESDALHFESFINKTLLIILKIFHIETIALYKYKDWNQQFDFEGSSGANGKVLDHDSFFLDEGLKELLNEKKGVLRKPFPISKFKDFDFLVELRQNNQFSGFIAIKDKKGSMMNTVTDDSLIKLGEEYGAVIGKIQKLTRIISEENKYKQLFRVTEKFHSSMNMDDLLGEIIITLQEVYPTFSYYLLLSQDNHNLSELPIIDLEYDSENIAAMQAYVTGTIQFEDSLLQRRSILYAPLKGKQGIYGVLQVIAPNTLVFPKNEVEFITLLAHTAGSALENAQLYQQSRKLISDLQLINETSHCLNSNLRLSETISYMSEQITRSFNAQEVGFILNAPDQAAAKVLPGSTEFFSSKQALLYIDYIKEKIQEENESLFIGDFSIPKIENHLSYRSLMAIPMDLSNHLIGFAIVLHREPYFFLFESFKLLQSLIHHSTLAFSNSMLREELEKMIITDHLTKLHSRNYLDEIIQQSMKEDDQGTFILTDIDDFKLINDTFGHQVGDEVLIQVSNLIHKNIRGNDIGARWGGEELAIYLPKVPLQAGVRIAERLVEKVAENSNPHVTLSCGVSYWNKDIKDSYNHLFKRADEALYIAKGTGKNKVVTQEDSIKAS